MIDPLKKIIKKNNFHKCPDKGRRDLVSNRHSYTEIKISFTDLEVD